MMVGTCPYTLPNHYSLTTKKNAYCPKVGFAVALPTLRLLDFIAFPKKVLIKSMSCVKSVNV